MRYAPLFLLTLSGLMLGQVRPETINKLDTVTKAKGLHYVVGCSSRDDKPKEDFYAGAQIPGHDSIACVEEGGKAEWWVSDYDTQQEAAEALLRILQGPPNLHPYHCEPPSKKIHQHRQCPPRIEGGIQ